MKEKIEIEREGGETAPKICLYLDLITIAQLVSHQPTGKATAVLGQR